MRNKGLEFLGLIALTGALGLSAKSIAPTLKKVTEFDLPGPPGKRFDYLTITPDDHYLLSAHLDAGQMYVIDLHTNKIVATVLDTPGAESASKLSASRVRRSTSSSMLPIASRYSTGLLWSCSATSPTLRMAVSGVRSSWEASDVKRRS